MKRKSVFTKTKCKNSNSSGNSNNVGDGRYEAMQRGEMTFREFQDGMKSNPLLIGSRPYVKPWVDNDGPHGDWL